MCAVQSTLLRIRLLITMSNVANLNNTCKTEYKTHRGHVNLVRLPEIIKGSRSLSLLNLFEDDIGCLRFSSPAKQNIEDLFGGGCTTKDTIEQKYGHRRARECSGRVGFLEGLNEQWAKFQHRRKINA